MYGCDSKPFVKIPIESETIVQDNEWNLISYDLNEFKYKGHVYVSLHTKNKVGGLTHAGHCPCNK